MAKLYPPYIPKKGYDPGERVSYFNNNYQALDPVLPNEYPGIKTSKWEKLITTGEDTPQVNVNIDLGKTSPITKEGRYVVATGTDDYVAYFQFEIPEYYEGLNIRVMIPNTNTTNSPTLSLNNMPAALIEAAIGELVGSIIYELNFDGSIWQVLGGSGGSSEADAVVVSFNATEDIAAFVAVTSTGKLADSGTIAYKNKVIGITKEAVLTGFVGKAVGFGQITNPGWAWTVGDKIFLNGTSLSTTAPSTGFIQIIGTATGATVIDVKIGQSVLL